MARACLSSFSLFDACHRTQESECTTARRWQASNNSIDVSLGHPQDYVVEAVCGERHEYRATILSSSIIKTIESRIAVRDVEIGRPSFSDPAHGR